jgi:hypothetical protein
MIQTNQRKNNGEEELIFRYQLVNTSLQFLKGIPHMKELSSYRTGVLKTETT